MRLKRLVLGVGLLLLFSSGCSAAEAGENGRIAYLNWDENGRVQLYAISPGEAQPEPLTNTDGTVHSYAVAPDGSQLVYSVQLDDQVSELWRLDLTNRLFTDSTEKLLTCERSLCSRPVWAPDSRRLIYEKQALSADGALGLPTLWWLNTQTGETLTVLEAAQPPNQAAAFSPDGQWVSFAAPADERIYLYGLENGRLFHLPTQLNAPAVWHPNSHQLIMADYNTTILHGDEGTDHLEHAHDAAQSIHLFIADIFSEARHPVTTALNVDDGSPVWSPDGEWAAFGRKPMFTNTGRQLWLVRADGSESIRLTDDLAYHHGSVSWSENGRFLLFQRFDTANPDTPPTIRLLNIQSQSQQEIAPAGFRPTWLP